MKLSRVAALALSLLIAAMFNTCGGSRTPQQVTHWQDPVHMLPHSDRSEKIEPVQLLGGATVSLHICDHRRRYGVQIPSGKTVTLTVPEGTSPQDATLTLSGCTRSPVDGQGTEVFVSRSVGTNTPPSAAHRLPIAARGWWPKQTVDLGPLAAGELVAIRFEDPAGGLLLLDEVALETTTQELSMGEPDGRLVILISLDTLRADAVGALGCEDCATPNLDLLVNASQVFTPHYSAASWTKPSHASLLSGQLPAGHGCVGTEKPIHSKLPLLAESFSAADFKTTGIVSNVVWLDAKFGFSRGFDSYSVVPWSAGQKVRLALNRMVTSRTEDHFVFLHAFEPHSDFYRIPYEGIGGTTAALEERFSVVDYGCREEICAANLLVALRDGKLTPLPREDEVLEFLYHAGISDLDIAVGQLIDGLKRARLWDDTLLVATSDHGESLLEHGRVEHGKNWESVLRVPLMIKWPQGQFAGETVSFASSAIDVMPTLLTAVGIQPPEHLLGRPLQEFQEPFMAAERPLFSGELNRVVWYQGFKLTTRMDDAVALFDLTQDPDELNNLITELPERREAMMELLERRYLAIKTFDGLAPGVELTEQDKSRLKALGYL